MLKMFNYQIDMLNELEEILYNIKESVAEELIKMDEEDLSKINKDNFKNNVERKVIEEVGDLNCKYLRLFLNDFSYGLDVWGKNSVGYSFYFKDMIRVTIKVKNNEIVDESIFAHEDDEEKLLKNDEYQLVKLFLKHFPIIHHTDHPQVKSLLDLIFSAIDEI